MIGSHDGGQGGNTPFNELAEEILSVLRRYLSEPTSRSVLLSAARRTSIRLDVMTTSEASTLVNQIGVGLHLFLHDADKLQNCKSLLRLIATTRPPGGTRPMPRATANDAPAESMRTDGISVSIRSEQDIVRARTLGKELAKQMGFTDVAQTKIATAISELARNIYQYAGSGEVRIRRAEGKRRGIEVVARDQGPGIQDPQQVLSGGYRSKLGMGAGLRGTKRLVDDFELDTHPGLGTTVRIRKYLE